MPTEIETLQTQLPAMSIGGIAAVVRRNWKPVNYAAAPYLGAMAGLNSINDDYGADSGRSVVAYFLANANTWRGETARAVKKELNKRLK